VEKQDMQASHDKGKNMGNDNDGTSHAKRQKHGERRHAQ
jgi:hypothetical protein